MFIIPVTTRDDAETTHVKKRNDISNKHLVTVRDNRHLL